MRTFEKPMWKVAVDLCCIALEFAVTPVFLMTAWNASIPDVFPDINKIEYKHAFMMRICVYSLSWAISNGIENANQQMRTQFYFENLLDSIEAIRAPNHQPVVTGYNLV